jgi:hypothetical protein
VEVKGPRVFADANGFALFANTDSNKLRSIPSWLPSLPLVELGLRHNLLHVLPKSFLQTRSLDWIQLTDNRLPRSLNHDFQIPLWRFYLQHCKFGLPWDTERLLWIALMKESPATCPLSMVDHNVMRLIIAECIEQIYMVDLDKLFVKHNGNSLVRP